MYLLLAANMLTWSLGRWTFALWLYLFHAAVQHAPRISTRYRSCVQFSETGSLTTAGEKIERKIFNQRRWHEVQLQSPLFSLKTFWCLYMHNSQHESVCVCVCVCVCVHLGLTQPVTECMLSACSLCSVPVRCCHGSCDWVCAYINIYACVCVCESVRQHEGECVSVHIYLYVTAAAAACRWLVFHAGCLCGWSFMKQTVKTGPQTLHSIHYTLCSSLKWEQVYTVWQECTELINSSGYMGHRRSVLCVTHLHLWVGSCSRVAWWLNRSPELSSSIALCPSQWRCPCMSQPVSARSRGVAHGYHWPLNPRELTGPRPVTSLQFCCVCVGRSALQHSGFC